jgi:hypothetical protein
VSRKGEQEAPAAARSKGTGLEAGRYLCLLAISELPSQFVNDEAIEALRSARERLASLPLTPDERPLIGLVLASIDRARGLLYPAPGETDSTAAWLDEAEAAHRYQGALDLLHDRRIKALRINDDIVQRLAMAKLALDLNRPGESSILLEQALVASRQIISDLTSAHAGERGLGPGDLRTERSEEQ